MKDRKHLFNVGLVIQVPLQTLFQRMIFRPFSYDFCIRTKLCHNILSTIAILRSSPAN